MDILGIGLRKGKTLCYTHIKRKVKGKKKNQWVN